MKLLKSFMLFVILFLCCFSNGQATEKNCDLQSKAYLENAQVKKIAVDLNQLVLLEDGMFIDVEGELFPVQFISYNEQGYQVGALYWECKNGHYQPLYTWPKCNKCGAAPRGF